MSAAIEPGTYAHRLARVQEALRADEADAMLVGVGPELEWLLGYAATGLERLNLLVVPAEGAVSLVVPRLEAPAARAAGGVAGGSTSLAIWDETDDPFALAAAVLPAPARGATGAQERRLLVSDGLRAAFLLRLQSAIRGARWQLASSLVGPLRRAKSAEEVSLLRAAAHAADRTILGLISGRLVGRSEADIAREVRERLVAEGHDTAAFWIVASGPNTASPHHEPGAREVRAGEPLLLDIGGRLGGYCSDITRTVWVSDHDGSTGPDDGFRRLYGLVEEAQAAGRAAARPGVALQDLDRAARNVIEAGGYGPHFVHRLGHGIGLEVHEEPYLVEGARGPLLRGDAFSVEPGIYLEGRHGARIEDIVVCTDDGADVLNHAGRALLVVSGG
jgi:Xaa-Pro aminopeptidase